ncbi:cupin domain-containing protein [Thiosulfativibrio zosterae]|uniref:Cupin n=1 Tax=Thiosulfativibrio zosterae TaxID=2675053 RepID=A0A6F8PNS4_9GAMM|nr:cupin domain-containing protein [Thiosulfativibrio zosterae]BBP43640.1 cupin [Thiosulfativibrio zosterae]
MKVFSSVYDVPNRVPESLNADTKPVENFNLDLTQKVVIETQAVEWQGSRSEFVLRKPLERALAESGRTTSLVTFLPGASFPQHSHPLGEEILVLSGVFSDETGHYPAGTYIRNPPGSYHSPYSREGCVLFVKLDQFDPEDSERVVLNTFETPWHPGIGGLQVMSLHSFKAQHTALVHWPKNEQFQPHHHWGGEEILVLSGEFCDEHGVYPAGSWLRSPHLSQHNPYVNEETVILVKTGHL